MSDEQIILGFAGVGIAAATPVFARIMQKLHREEAKLDASFGALAVFLSIFGGLLAKDRN